MSTGPESFGAVSGQLFQQSQGLRAAVDSGQLVMAPEAAARVAEIYDEKADDVRNQVASTQRLVTNDAYGACYIGRALEKKFNDKVTGTGGDAKDGLAAILREAEQILRDMAQAYRDSAREMLNTDDENARNLGRNA